MNKTILKVTVAVLALILTGCGAQSQDQASSSSSTSVKTEKKQEQKQDKKQSAKSSSQKEPQKETSSQTSGSIASSQSSSNNNSRPAPNNESRLSKLNADLNRTLGHVVLPQNDGLGQGSSQLNIRFTGDSDNYTVYYSVGNKARPLNDPAIRNEAPYATLSKKTYSSFVSAKAAVDYRSGDGDQGLPTVDLGHDITGTIDSGAGNRYLHWNEGQWSLVVHAAAVNGEDPQPMAKQVVEMLENSYLPAPNSVAAGEFEINGNNKLTWQDGKTVYSLEGQSVQTIITMAASIN
ncbi:hypothetical protein [Ligilactobacillus pobuzihii]|uniref:Lipoprotein n=1 Tax=Ligilactobacillus pobuzihii TaxID=449659 RepID=A0A0R2L9Y3_9LACO|nr:hypothetical protein [Ligilactobacillus pobuzihii]KRK11124.1 lipoprotein [Ligilactobacillus pobuzihii E100301 = KCTC 13174]KRN95930.1 lipoprotein [Ligilactobacillus pobuzihii]GEN47697.1 lipoprotein [Ligilactobacillus pobuzihii]